MELLRKPEVHAMNQRRKPRSGRKRRGRRRNAEGRAKPGRDAQMPPSLPCVRTLLGRQRQWRDDDRFQFVIRLPPVAFWRKSVIPHQNQPVGFQSELGVNDAPTKRCHPKKRGRGGDDFWCRNPQHCEYKLNEIC